MNTELVRRWLQFAQLVAGVLIFTAGVVQCAFSHPFRRDRNRALIALGIAGVLYGVRLLADDKQPVRDLIGAPPLFWVYVDTYISYVILVPILYFIELTFGTGWHHSIRWMRRVVTAYAAAAMVIDAVTRTPRIAKGPNGYVVVAAIAVLVWNRWRGVLVSESFRAHTGAARIFRVVSIGLLVFGGFVLFQNIVDDRVLRGEWNVEWAGVLVLLGCLGYVAVSQAMDNDRRLHELRHELETARQIQASILPQRVPAIDGLDFGARYLPMTSVAGDFYDFLELGSGRVGVLVADVSGHGVPAALIASMVKVAFVAQSDHADDPARVLAGMNQVFCGRLERQFVTAAYAYIDAVGGRLRYGAAGHPPALLVNRSGDPNGIAELAENGVMLGHFPEWPYTSVERTFRPGDRLILYTDGLIEATDVRGEFFDAERLRAFGRNGPARTADAFADALVSHVRAWSGHLPSRGFDDDVTVVVVDCLSRSRAG
jgi:sigma-B regulation protein RsbU (phosphoserine phosphatase)